MRLHIFNGFLENFEWILIDTILNQVKSIVNDGFSVRLFPFSVFLLALLLALRANALSFARRPARILILVLVLRLLFALSTFSAQASQLKPHNASTH